MLYNHLSVHIVVILYIIKNYDLFMDVKNVNRNEIRVFDVKINNCGKSFGRKYINYSGPKHYNSMSVRIKHVLFTLNGEPWDYKHKKEILQFCSFLSI